MAAQNYDEALRRLLVHEGGYTNHPSDPGGPTNFGITIADYRQYVKRDATAADVKAMPLSAAKKIYRARYWDALRCDDLPGGVDYAVFDYGVNSGNGRAIKVLERLLGLPADGRPDDTLVARANAADAASLVARICDERLTFLKGLKTWPVFGGGWGRRVAECRTAALRMAGPRVAIAAIDDSSDDVTPTEGVSVGAAIEPPKGMASSNIGNGAVAGGGLGVAALGTTVWDKITELPDSITQALLAAAHKPVFWLMLAAVGTAGFIWWKRYRLKQDAGV